MTHLSMGDVLQMVRGKEEAKNTNNDQSHGSHDPDHLPVERSDKGQPQRSKRHAAEQEAKDQGNDIVGFSHRCTCMSPASTERLSVKVDWPGCAGWGGRICPVSSEPDWISSPFACTAPISAV